MASQHSLFAGTHGSYKNLLRIYESASREAVIGGMTWYDEAQDIVQKIAKSFRESPRIIAATIAVTSPMKRWDINIRDAKTIIEHVRNGELDESNIPVSGLRFNTRKAIQILRGEPIEEHLKGPKVNAFFENLLGNYEIITVDSHSIWAWLGSEQRGSVKFPRSVYESAHKDFCKAADLTGFENAKFQAIIWMARKQDVNSIYVEPEGF